MDAPPLLYVTGIVASIIMPLWRSVTDWRNASDPCPVRQNGAYRAGLELVVWDMVIALGSAAGIYVAQKALPVDWSSKVMDASSRLESLAAYAFVFVAAFSVGLGAAWLSRLASRPKDLAAALELSRGDDHRRENTRRSALRKLGDGRDLWMARYAQEHADRLSAAGLTCADVAARASHFVRVRAMNNDLKSRSLGKKRPDLGRVLKQIEDISNDFGTPPRERMLTLVTLMLENGGRDVIAELKPHVDAVSA